MFRSFAFSLLIVATMLAGCAPDPMIANVHATLMSGSKCDIAQLAKLPLETIGRSYAVPATVDGKPAVLLLDTGSVQTVLSAASYKYLGLGRDPDLRLLHGAGLGGTAYGITAIMKSFDLGGFTTRDKPVAVGIFTIPLKHNPPVVGLLGAQFLSAFDLDIDLSHGDVMLYGSKHCPEGYLPWRGRYVEVAAEVTQDGWITIPVQLDGHQMTGLLDTGSSTTVLTAKGLELLGLPKSPGGDTTVNVNTADGHILAGRRHQFGSLTFGHVEWRYPNILVAGGSNENSAMPPLILGLDFLHLFRVWIDYANNQIFLAPQPNPRASLPVPTPQTGKAVPGSPPGSGA